MGNIRKFLLALLCTLIVSTGWSSICFAQDEIQLPTWEDFQDNITVTSVISDAWNDTLEYGKEEGGWIYQNTTTGELKVVRVDRGTNILIGVPYPKPEEGWRAVGFFHTHPRYAEGDGRGLSDTDLDPNNSLDVPELMWDEDGYHPFGPERGIFQRQPPEPPTHRIQMSPNEATIILGKTHMPPFNALLDGDPIDSQNYTAKWHLGPGASSKVISTEPALTEKVFLQAVGSKPGSYWIFLEVEDKATGKVLNDLGSDGMITVKGEVDRWVSAVPGKGRVYHQEEGKPEWEGFPPAPRMPELLEECDVDLRVTDTTGSLTLTVTSTTDQMPGRIGSKSVLSIENWKDDGKTISFNIVGQSGAPIQLTRTTDGHLTAHIIYPATEGFAEAEETWDLIPSIE